MATTEKEMGTAIASPEQTQWCSLEECEKFEKCIGRNYTRKDKKDSKKFFYKVIGLHPTQPAVNFKPTQENIELPSSDSFLIAFEVQKYHRNKYVASKVRDAQNPQVSTDIQVNQQVDAHEMRNGKWICVDPTASFFRDARDFLKEFEVDSTE